jgi:hypothetical protein
MERRSGGVFVNTSKDKEGEGDGDDNSPNGDVPNLGGDTIPCVSRFHKSWSRRFFKRATRHYFFPLS